jgi:hypothetical protein
MGLGWVIASPNLVVRGTPIPYGYIFLFTGGLGLIGCLFGLNVFKGGPLDMNNDPVLPREPARPESR